MFRLLFQCIEAFGVNGLFVYFHLKVKSQNIRLPKIPQPVKLRQSYTDQITFKEIFIKREYDIVLPFETQVKIIIDAGANIGFTTVFFANKYPDAKIFSVEPDEENYELLLANIRNYSQVKGIQSAIWPKKEKINAVDRGFGKRGLVIEKSEKSSLLATSIQDLMEENNLQHIDILKMDIEGSEKEVFESNYEWLSKTKCLIIELHDRMKPGCSKAVFAALSNYDFSMSIKGENLVFINNKLT